MRGARQREQTALGHTASLFILNVKVYVPDRYLIFSSLIKCWESITKCHDALEYLSELVENSG